MHKFCFPFAAQTSMLLPFFLLLSLAIDNYVYLTFTLPDYPSVAGTQGALLRVYEWLTELTWPTSTAKLRLVANRLKRAMKRERRGRREGRNEM